MTGKAATSLRPSGMAELDGQRVDVVTSGEFIEQGAAIEVISVKGAVVRVRALRTVS